VQYDRGAWEGQRRLNFCRHTNGIPADLMATVNDFRAEGWSKTNISEVLKEMHLKLDKKRQRQYDDPCLIYNMLFEYSYEYKGYELDDCKDCCNIDYTISRSQRGEGARRPFDESVVHFGNITSSK